MLILLCIPLFLLFPLWKRRKLEVDDHTARRSNACIIIFVFISTLTGTLASMPGEYWPVFATSGPFILYSLIRGPRFYRILGSTCGILFITFIYTDIKNGHAYEKEMKERRLRIITEKANREDSSSHSSGPPQESKEDTLQNPKQENIKPIQNQ